MPNNFCLCNDSCDTEYFVFPALDLDQDCAGVPSLSQVCGLVIIPSSADLPSDWEDRDAWGVVVDNSEDGAGKYLTGVGRVDEPEDTNVVVAKGQVVKTISLYTLEIEVYNLSNTQYEFLRALQCNPLNYVFWFENVSGHLWGGPTGITPFLTDVDFPLGDGDGDLEKAVLTIQWRAKCDPPRTYIEDLSVITELTEVIGDPDAGEILGDPDTGEMIGH